MEEERRAKQEQDEEQEQGENRSEERGPALPSGRAGERRGETARRLIRRAKQASRRKFPGEEKIHIVMEGIRADVSVADLCRREGIHPTIYYKWLNDFMEAGKGRLRGDAKRLMALILASVGLYGVTAYSVERRTNEIGIRMALGADRMSVLGLVLRAALVEMGIALVIGIPATIAAGHAMAAQLFGVKPYDPRILVGTAAVLVVAAFLAEVIPARRAATLDPARALYTE